MIEDQGRPTIWDVYRSVERRVDDHDLRLRNMERTQGVTNAKLEALVVSVDGLADAVRSTTRIGLSILAAVLASGTGAIITILLTR